MQRRAFLAFPVLGLVAACAGPAPTRAVLGSDLLARYRITAVSVDLSAVGPTTDSGRSVFTSEVQTALERSANSKLVGLGSGSAPATAVLAISSVNIISAGQAYVIGGESVMRGTVSVVDGDSGQTLMQPVKVSSGGGGWVLGGVVGVLTMDEPEAELRQLSDEFSDRAATLIAGRA